MISSVIVFANIVDYLDAHQGAFAALLTAALVLVTAFYAWQNRQMVLEMKRSRDTAILPKLALEFHRLGPNVVSLAIRNVGPGAALDIDVRTEWVPLSTEDDAPGTRWRRNLLSPGEQAELFPPGDLGANLNTLPERFREVRLKGSLRDAAGNEHRVDEAFADLPEWRRVLEEANESWHAPEPERRMADAFQNKFQKPLKDLTKATNEVAAAVRDLNRTHNPDP